MRRRADTMLRSDSADSLTNGRHGAIRLTRYEFGDNGGMASKSLVDAHITIFLDLAPVFYIAITHLESVQLMALNFEDEETDRLAREVAKLTGETLTVAIRRALAERLERERLRPGEGRGLADRLLAIGEHCASLPDIDPRTPDEIVGYDESGMWR
jgi:antitoxin VapB